MTASRLAQLAAAAALATALCACGRGRDTVAGDLYQTRLSVENMQADQRSQLDAIGDQITTLRMNSDQEAADIQRRLNLIEERLDAIQNALYRLEGGSGSAPSSRTGSSTYSAPSTTTYTPPASAADQPVNYGGTVRRELILPSDPESVNRPALQRPLTTPPPRRF